MAEIVNLRRVKKARARAEAAREADTNRALHGRTRGERAADESAARRRETVLDQARIDTTPAATADPRGGERRD